MFHKFYSPVKNEDVYIFAEIVKKKKKKTGRKEFSITSLLSWRVIVGRTNGQDPIAGL